MLPSQITVSILHPSSRDDVTDPQSGMNQARALGQHWASTPITAVYCSDLKRAHSTAQALVAGQPGQAESEAETEKVIELVVTPLLREQNFGIAEGKPWAAAPGSSPNGRSALITQKGHRY
jgi:broad specificity phosphatase PhoE